MHSILALSLLDAPRVWLHPSAFSLEHAVHAFSPLGVTDSYMYIFLTQVWMSAVIIYYSI